MRRVLAAALSLAFASPARPAEPPSFRWRGVFEGFYGRPWSWEQRERLLPWMARHGFNLLVIGPKDEPLQRARWREPLPPEYLAALEKLSKRGRAEGVELAWVLSPGLDFRGLIDADAAVEKLAAVAGAGVEKLAIAFDDTPADPGHVDFANAVARRLLEARPKLELTFIPAHYWGEAAPSEYLDRAARRLDGRFRVGWSGPQIISRTVTAESARSFREHLRRPLVLGDNYPVQDRLVDAGRLFLGPLAGRDPALARLHEGYLANASPLLEAAKPALATAGAFARAPARYEPAAAWVEALDSLAAPRARAAFRLFASQNSSSWLSPSSSELEPAMEAWWEDRDRAALPALLRRLELVDLELRSGIAPELYRELRPWSEKLSLQARAARAWVEGDAERGRRLALEADRAPAVVADLAFERFLAAAERREDEKDAPFCGSLVAELRRHAAGDRERAPRLARCLEQLEAAPARLASLDRGSRDLRELAPALELLAARARAARLALAGRPPSALSERVERWRLRLAFVPLMAYRDLLDEHLGVRATRRRGALRAWLLWQRAARPGGLAARLQLGLSSGTGLRETLSEMAAYSSGLRLAGAPAELGPWLRKVEDYALLSLRRMDGTEPTALERERLRSGNGLELALELKQALDAFIRWSRLPADRRPPDLDLTLPPNPADLL